MGKIVIKSNRLAPPIGPYSHAVKASNFIFLSGQIGLDKNGKVVQGGISEQTKQALENMKAILEDAGYSLDDVVKVTVFLKDIRHFSEMNEVYKKYFPFNQPARSTVEANMASPDLLVEIEAIAYKDS
ncbi:MAG: RidA family protein [Nitrososphaerales archaeon]